MAGVIKLLITTEAEDVFEVEVNGDLDVETLEALCEIETGVYSLNSMLMYQKCIHQKIFRFSKYMFYQIQKKRSEKDIPFEHG